MVAGGVRLRVHRRLSSTLFIRPWLRVEVTTGRTSIGCIRPLWRDSDHFCAKGMGSFIRLKYLRRFIGVVALVLALVLAMTVIAPLCVPGTTKGRGFDARSIEAQLENLEEIKLLVGDRVLSEPEIEYLERMVRFCFQDRLRSLMQTDPRVRKELRQPRPRQQAPRVRVVAKALSLIGQLGRPGR